MIKHPDSHLDHGLTDGQVDHILTRFAARDGFLCEAIELPPELGTVPCGLHGPAMGDPPVDVGEVSFEARGTRAWLSRMVPRPVRPTRTVTVVAGPHKGACLACDNVAPETSGPNGMSCLQCNGAGVMEWSCVIYTVYGGPPSPQEPGDPDCIDRDASADFWRDHALSK